MSAFDSTDIDVIDRWIRRQGEALESIAKALHKQAEALSRLAGVVERLELEALDEREKRKGKS